MIGPDSRYAACVLYIDGQEEFLGARPRIDTSPQPDDVFHTVVEGDLIDLIAYRCLGRADLWWIICDYNDVFFPLELQAGVVLRMPSVENARLRLLL